MKHCPHKHGRPKDPEAAKKACGYEPKRNRKTCIFYRIDINDGCDRAPNHKYPFNGLTKEQDNDKDADPSNPGAMFVDTGA